MKTTMRLVAAALLLACSLSADTLETVFFRANLSPANEVPAITGLNYSGKATVAFHLRRNDAGAIVSGVVDYDIDYSFTDAVTVTGLHIHQASAGVNGPIVIESGISNSNTVAITAGAGNLFRQIVIDSGNALAALGNILANPGGFYVNLHTSANTGGVMRDQMTRMEVLVVRAIMDPANENPPITGLNASGTGSAFILATRNAAGMIDGGTVRFDVSYRFPGAVTFRGLHIHPGVAGVNGPAVLDTDLSANNTIVDADGVGTISKKAEVIDAADLNAIRLLFANPAGAYMNLHTTDNTGGAIRGQLQPTTETSLQFPMSSDQENPPVQPPATGLAKASIFATRDAAGVITSGTVIFDVNYNFPGAITLRGFHIHNGATGVNGPVVIDSGLTSSNTLVDDDGVGNTFKVIDVGPDNANGVAALRSIPVTPENHYLNLHSTVNTGGHIRGQLVMGTAPVPALSSNGIVSATFAAGVNAASSGSLISIFGSNQARATGSGIVVNGRLGTNISGTEVRIGNVLAPLLYVSPSQINAQVPFEVAAGTQPVTVTTPGGTSAAQNLTVSAVAPAIFVVVKNSNFSLTTATNTAQAGDLLAIFTTGLTGGTPALQNGQLGPASPLSILTPTPTVTIGGVNAQVQVAAQAPGFAGVQQVNVVVPAGLTGVQPVRVSTGGSQSNSYNVTLQ